MDGVMPAADAVRWRAHLAACAVCARYDRVLRRGASLLRAERVEPDPQFVHHLRYRLASEDQRMPFGPVTAGTSTIATVAAVLALAVWLPLTLLSRGEAPRAAVAQELGRTAAEIAWHGGSALNEADPHVPARAPVVRLNHAHATVTLVDRGYTPLVIDPPTAPPSHTRVTLTSLTLR